MPAFVQSEIPSSKESDHRNKNTWLVLMSVESDPSLRWSTQGIHFFRVAVFQSRHRPVARTLVAEPYTYIVVRYADSACVRACVRACVPCRPRCGGASQRELLDACGDRRRFRLPHPHHSLRQCSAKKVRVHRLTA
jgi:hypothetical protein